MKTFLQINKKYLNTGLRPLELLILAQIEEFIRNGQQCYVTNDQFASMFSVTKPTVDKALERLEELNYIARITTVVTSNGRANRQRTLVLKKREEPKKVQPKIKEEKKKETNKGFSF